MANHVYGTLLNQLIEPSSYASILCWYVTDMLKMCMGSKFNEGKIFFDKFTAFLT